MMLDCRNGLKEGTQMNYIKKLTIKGFKKFSSFQIEFNEHMNIIVGENEAGKTTILEALRVVLNQQYKNSDKSVLQDLFNKDMVKRFQDKPSIKALPEIMIEVEFELDAEQGDAGYFYGENYGERNTQPEAYGIRFECKFDDEIGSGLESSICEGKIPYEYYVLSWATFAGRPYKMVKKPIEFISIDTTTSNAALSFNYYNKTLFSSKYDEETRMRARNSFREGLNKAFEDTGLENIGDNRRFGVDNKKVVLESVLSVYEGDIPLENHGSGMESLIKTKIALDRKNKLDVILMEEPENHLSFSSLRKMLQEISEQQKKSQIIVATHSNMIASRLNLKNVLWITDTGVASLKTVDDEIAKFFEKADDNSFLELLLSKKAILVEGATEYLLLPYFYQKLTGDKIECDEISVISCDGIAYKKYLKIAEATHKKIAVLTDNDGHEERIAEALAFNQDNQLQHVFMADDIEKWTWEVCVYKENKTLLEDVIKIVSGSKYEFSGIKYGGTDPILGKMLNDKVESAYQMLMSGKDYVAPQYVKEAIEWIRE